LDSPPARRRGIGNYTRLRRAMGKNKAEIDAEIEKLRTGA
jgi:hypothetical protein